MAKFKVVVSDQVFPSVDTERSMLAEIDAELEVAEGDMEEVLSVASDADAILNTYLPWDEPALARLGHCRIIARYGIGVDNIDLEAARRHDIVVTNVPDYSVEEVVHALALMLAALRRIPHGREDGGRGPVGDRRGAAHPPAEPAHRWPARLRADRTKLGAFSRSSAPMSSSTTHTSPRGGRSIARRVRRIAGAGRHHLDPRPAHPGDQGIIDSDAIARMRPGAILINTSGTAG